MSKFLIIFFLIMIGISSSVYTLNEAEQAIILKFGQPISDKPITDAGLHFKLPIMNTVIKFDKRILEWDGEPSSMTTKDNLTLKIDIFARWVISDPLKFYISGRNETYAKSLLNDYINGATRQEISNWDMERIVRHSNRELIFLEDDFRSQDLDEKDKNASNKENKISGARIEITNNIMKSISDILKELDIGITVIDIQLKRIDLDDKNQRSLFNRMITFQNTIAETHRAQGRGQKEEILGDQISKEKEIISSSYFEAQKIRGEADAEAVKIYAESYGRAPEFYNFIESLNAYSQTIDSTTSLILSTDNKFLKYFSSEK